MALPVEWTHVPGILAGALILVVGLFVLVARPRAWLHRLFFLLAVVDGLSTAFYRLSYHADLSVGVLFRGLYLYYYVAFIAVLLIFGVLFPKPLASTAMTTAIVALVVAGGVAICGIYALDHPAFWSLAGPDASTRYTNGPMGNALAVAFVAGISLVLLRTTASFLRDHSPSHRRQAALVLGGMVLAYAPQPTTILVTALAESGAAPLFASRPDRLAAYWSYVLFCGALAYSAWVLARHGRARLEPTDRRFLAGCYLGVTALTILAIAFADPIVAQVLRQIALLAYPVVLGFAIARYEVFDIDRQIRRAATVTFAAMGLTVAFVLVESAAETLLQERVFAGIPSAWLSGTAAGIVATVGFVPVARASRKAASKLVPELTVDELHKRKLEIYRHSLAGALADGILKEGESRTLSALRESLGISERDHQRLLSEVAA